MEQLVKFNGNNTDLFVKQNMDGLKATAEIVVPETHFALVVHDGQVMEAASAGRFPLFDTKNGLFRIKKANNKSVDIIYISKTVKVQMRWGTPTPLRLRDPETDTALSLGMSGELEFKVKLPKKFYLEIVGSELEYDVDDLRKRVLGKLTSVIESAVLRVMKNEGISYTEIDEKKTAISDALRAELSRVFEDDYGLTICSFIISNYIIPDADIMAIERARNVLKSKGELNRVNCVACDALIPENATFCHECGARQTERKCRKCGTINAATAKFCNECGAKIKE